MAAELDEEVIAFFQELKHVELTSTPATGLDDTFLFAVLVKSFLLKIPALEVFLCYAFFLSVHIIDISSEFSGVIVEILHHALFFSPLVGNFTMKNLPSRRIVVSP